MTAGPQDLAREAHDYAAMGWAVFPLQPREKKPYGFTTGLKAASRDLDLVAGWWTGRQALPLRERKPSDRWFPDAVRPKPGSNIAMATGAASGCWVLDIDGEEGIASLLALAAKHGRLPVSVRQATGGGGGQIFYQWPGVLPWGVEIRNGASSFADHLDVRGAGGYVVLPPSIHPSGRPYRWVEGCAPWEMALAPAPWWLLRLVARPPQAPAAGPRRVGRAQPDDRGPSQRGGGYAEGALTAACAEVTAAPVGQQNATLHRNAYGIGRLVAGGALAAGPARAALVNAALRMACGDPRRPWTEADAGGVIERAFQRAQAAPRTVETETRR